MHSQRTHLVTALVPGLELQSAAGQARVGEHLASSTLKMRVPDAAGGVEVQHNTAVRKKIQAQGAEPVANTRQEMAAFLQSQGALWGKVSDRTTLKAAASEGVLS